MWPVLLTLIVFVLSLGAAAFVWFWWKGPIDQVPPHLDDKQLRRLEVQDRLRQTSYQVLTAFGLLATFVATLFQLMISSQHWSAEFEGRLRQERLGQFVEAVKQLTQSEKDASSRSTKWIADLAGVSTISNLGTQYPEEYYQQAEGVLSVYVRSKTTVEFLKESGECSNDLDPASATKLGDREEAEPGVQAAMAALGNPKFARVRRVSTPMCVSDREKPPLRLEHLFLDDLDLSNLDLSCSLFSNSKFRRVSFRNADLSHADLRGIRLADFEVPGSPAAVGSAGYNLWDPKEVSADTTDRSRSSVHHGLIWLKGILGKPEGTNGASASQPDAAMKSKDTVEEPKTKVEKPKRVEEWKRYRCWITDLRLANLIGANLEGATLGGADLRGADVTGANFCRTDISRVNFQGAIGLDPQSLKEACAGSPDGAGFDMQAQPVGLPASFAKNPIRRCNNDHKCPYELVSDKSDSSAAPAPNAAPEPNSEPKTNSKPKPIYLWDNVLLILFLALAWFVFWWVGRFARRRLEVSLGPDTVEFASRFPEREAYTTDQLNQFVTQYPSRAEYYIWPVLFPLDVLVMLLLAVSMGAISYYWVAQALPTAYERWALVALIAPVAYLVADFVEDLILALALRSALKSQKPISECRVTALKCATKAKFATISLTIATVVVGLVIYLAGTSCNWSYFDRACVERTYPKIWVALGLPTDLSFLDRRMGKAP